jgi:preprotein translocase subunit SecG
MILVYLGGLIVLAAALSVLVILQVDKEKELVELAGFGKGSTGWSAMLQRLGFFAGLPALSLLAGRFPELRLLLGNWLGPLVEAVK